MTIFSGVQVNSIAVLFDTYLKFELFSPHFDLVSLFSHLIGLKFIHNLRLLHLRMDTMASASHQRKSLFSAEEIADLTKPSADSMDCQWSYDIFPCPIDQFEIVYQIVDLYKSQPDPENPSQEILLRVAEFKHTMLTRKVHIERGMYWLHLTEAYRHAIILYLLRLFHCGNDGDEIAWLTGSVFYHAKSCPPSTVGVTSCSGPSSMRLWRSKMSRERIG
jgi:hypothetical protein